MTRCSLRPSTVPSSWILRALLLVAGLAFTAPRAGAAGEAWSPMSPAGTPVPPCFAVTTMFDPVDYRLMLVGGYGQFSEYGVPVYNDGADPYILDLHGEGTWLGNTASTGDHSSAVYKKSAALVYDPVYRRMIVHGGATTNWGDYTGDLWQLDLQLGLDWTWVWKPHMSPYYYRVGHTGIYDPIADRMVMFGGDGWDGYDYGRKNDVSTVSLVAKTLGFADWGLAITNGTPPSGRAYHSAIYDRRRRRMIVFGGQGSTGLLGDVWELRLADMTWKQLAPSGVGPSARAHHTAVYDPGCDRMIVFGGSDGLFKSDTWALSLAPDPPVWEQLTPTGSTPYPRARHSAVYDPVRRRMIVFGGLSIGNTALNDLHELTMSCPSPALDVDAVYPVDDSHLEVVFSGPVDPTTATDVTHYTLQSFAPIDDAVLAADSASVLLTVGGGNGGTAEVLTVSGVKSRDGVPMAGAAPTGPPVFSRTDRATGTSPFAVATGDFDRDGLVDVAVTNSGANTVSIMLGQGGGLLGAKTDHPVGTNPQGIAVGDLNADGKPDLAVTNFGSNSVGIMLGDGDGSFGPATPFATGAGPIGVAIGDFNLDQAPDLAVTNYASTTTISVLLGSGDGAFGAKVDYTVGINPVSIATGDLNGDGYLDLAVSNWSSASMSVLLGDGSGAFGPHTQHVTGGRPISGKLADLDGDGELDFVAADWSGSLVRVLLGTGAGGFAAVTSYGAQTRAYSLWLADVTSDGRPDVVTGSNTVAVVSLLVNNGDGTFQAKQDLSVGSVPVSVTAADLNGDGRPDPIATGLNANTVSLLVSHIPQTASFRAGITPISDVQAAGPGGASQFAGQMVTVRGVVTAGSETFGNGAVFLTAPGGGPYNAIKLNTPPLGVAIGDDVIASGLVVEANGRTELAPMAYAGLQSSGNPVPAPIHVSLSQLRATDPDAEAFEGVLVAVSGQVASDTVVAAGQDFHVRVGTDTLLVLHHDDVGYIATPGQTVSLAGVLDIVDGRYALRPRGAADLFGVTGVGGQVPSPATVALGPSVPNPMGRSGSISYSLAREGHALLTILDTSGRIVRVLANGWMEPGPHTARWDGTNALGERVGPGVYFSRLEAGGQVLNRKVVLAN